MPPEPFDLVMSTLAVHHLSGPGKADLFARIAEVLIPGGRFVLADLVVPDDSAEVVTPIDWVEDTPSSLEEQLGWLAEAGLNTRVHWQHYDFAVVFGSDPIRTDPPPTAAPQPAGGAVLPEILTSADSAPKSDCLS